MERFYVSFGDVGPSVGLTPPLLSMKIEESIIKDKAIKKASISLFKKNQIEYIFYQHNKSIKQIFCPTTCRLSHRQYNQLNSIPYKLKIQILKSFWDKNLQGGPNVMNNKSMVVDTSSKQDPVYKHNHIRAKLRDSTKVCGCNHG